MYSSDEEYNGRIHLTVNIVTQELGNIDRGDKEKKSEPMPEMQNISKILNVFINV